MGRWIKAPELLSPTSSCEFPCLEYIHECLLTLSTRVEFGKPVLYAHDIKKGCWYLGVASDLIADGGMLLNAHGAINALFFQRPKPETTRPRIPRPPNAYILYRKERHQIVKGKRPGITNNEICEYHVPFFWTHTDSSVAQVLGRCWNMEHPDIRTYYKKMADDIKEEHKRLYPDYQYRPLKPTT